MCIFDGNNADFLTETRDTCLMWQGLGTWHLYQILIWLRHTQLWNAGNRFVTVHKNNFIVSSCSQLSSAHTRSRKYKELPDDRTVYLLVSWRLVISSAGVWNIYNLHGLAAIRWAGHSAGSRAGSLHIGHKLCLGGYFIPVPAVRTLASGEHYPGLTMSGDLSPRVARVTHVASHLTSSTGRLWSEWWSVWSLGQYLCSSWAVTLPVWSLVTLIRHVTAENVLIRLRASLMTFERKWTQGTDGEAAN